MAIVVFTTAGCASRSAGFAAPLLTMPGTDIASNVPAAVFGERGGDRQKSTVYAPFAYAGALTIELLVPHHNHADGEVFSPLAVSSSTSIPLRLPSCALVCRSFMLRCT